MARSRQRPSCSCVIVLGVAIGAYTLVLIRVRGEATAKVEAARRTTAERHIYHEKTHTIDGRGTFNVAGGDPMMYPDLVRQLLATQQPGQQPQLQAGIPAQLPALAATVRKRHRCQRAASKTLHRWPSTSRAGRPTLAWPASGDAMSLQTLFGLLDASKDKTPPGVAGWACRTLASWCSCSPTPSRPSCPHCGKTVPPPQPDDPPAPTVRPGDQAAGAVLHLEIDP